MGAILDENEAAALLKSFPPRNKLKEIKAGGARKRDKKLTGNLASRWLFISFAYPANCRLKNSDKGG